MDWRVELGDGIWYDNEPDTYGLDLERIRRIEKLRNCRYVCEWNTLDNQGNVNESPMLIFWNDTPHPQGSNWMALFSQSGEWYVRDGITASRMPILAYVSDDGQAVFSKYRHDFRSSRDGTITVDGGRDYTKLMGNFKTCRRVWLLPQAGEIRIIDESAALLMQSKENEHALR